MVEDEIGHFVTQLHSCESSAEEDVCLRRGVDVGSNGINVRSLS